jgi:hypothetical protein
MRNKPLSPVEDHIYYNQRMFMFGDKIEWVSDVIPPHIHRKKPKRKDFVTISGKSFTDVFK